MSDLAPAGRTTSVSPAVQRLVALIDAICRIDGWAAAACLCGLTLLMIAEIAVSLLGKLVPGMPSSVPMAWELSAYLMGAAFTFGASMTLRAGSHIRVTLLLARLGPAMRRLLEIAATAVAAAFVAFLAYSMIEFTWSSYARGEVSISSNIPLWPPKAVLTAGVCLLATQLVARLFLALAGQPLEDSRLRVAAVAD